MKKFLLVLFAISICLKTAAAEIKNIPYKPLKENCKISVINEVWSKKVAKKTGNYYVKHLSDFYNPDETLAFTTDCDYIFLNNGQLLGYSNSDLKFYRFNLNDGLISKTELSEDEIQALFKDYKIIKISDFVSTTNSIKIKKGFGKLNLIILNDTDRVFNNYSFTTGNSKIEAYTLSGVVSISKKGMVLFSKFGENTKNYPRFVILVR